MLLKEFNNHFEIEKKISEIADKAWWSE